MLLLLQAVEVLIGHNKEKIIMKKILLTSLILFIVAFLASCNEVKTADTLDAAAELKYELKDASEMYTNGVKTFEESANFFDPVEQRLVRSSFKKIDRAKDEIKKIFSSNTLDTVIALSRFQRNYGEMRAAYSTIESVLAEKNGISPVYQKFIDDVHEKVVDLDGLVSRLKPSEKSQIDYQAVAGIISATAALVGNVRPIVSQ